MKLVANGCSFTEGHKDKFNNQPPNWVWPSLFKSTEEFSSVVNLATEGGSNDRLVRTTLEYFNSNTSEDTILVLQHPTPNRKEWYNTQHHMWIGYVTSEDDTLIDLSSSNFTIDNMEMLQTDTATQRKLVHQNKLLVETDITETINYFKNIILIQNFCKNNNIPCLHVGLSARCLPRFYFKESREIVANNVYCKQLYKMIDENIFCDKFLTDICRGYEESPTDGHPNEEGHEIIFRYIYNEIKKRWQI
jgi:hypothetical protein